MLLNMCARLVWVGIILFPPLDGDYKSERKNKYIGTSQTYSEINQNKCPLHVEAGEDVFFMRHSAPALMLSLFSQLLKG